MSTQKTFSAIVLAAGKGTRMKTPLPKVLHPVAGLPMISWVLQAVRTRNCRETRVVLGHGLELIKPIVEAAGAIVFEQKQQRGTADAVKAAEPGTLNGLVVIVNGDHPLLTADDLEQLVSEHLSGGQDVSVVSAVVKNPAQLGRIVRSGGDLKAIVETKDAGPEALKIKEVNTGIYLCDAKLLAALLALVKPHNAQKEFYLTDIITEAQKIKKKVQAIKGSARLAFGVNNQIELARASKVRFKQKLHSLMESGVMVVDPDTTYVDGDVQIGEGTMIYPGATIQSGTRIGKACIVGPHATIKNCEILDGVEIKTGCVMEESTVRKNSSLGPYAHIRPGTVIGENCKVGNFVEMKKVVFGDGSKASHLTYLGDADIGKDVNIGCGTITCNYAADKKKYKTIIGDRVFVGSDSQLVAPVTIGDDAYIGSGSTITKNVPAKALGVARSKQVNIPDYTPKPPKTEEK